MKFSEMQKGYYYRITCDYRLESKLGEVNLKGELVLIESFSLKYGCFRWRKKNGNQEFRYVGLEYIEPVDKNPK